MTNIPDSQGCNSCNSPIVEFPYITGGKLACLDGNADICRSCCADIECANFRDEQEEQQRNDGTLPVVFTRGGGIGDYIGAHATFTLRDQDYLVDIVGQRYREGSPACWLFKVRHFNGEYVAALENSEIAASAVRILDREWKTAVAS